MKKWRKFGNIVLDYVVPVIRKCNSEVLNGLAVNMIHVIIRKITEEELKENEKFLRTLENTVVLR